MLKAVETRDPVFLPDDEDMPGFGRSDGQISEDDQAQGAVDKASQKYADDAHLLALGASLADKFKDVKLPEGKLLIPGVIESSTCGTSHWRPLVTIDR